MVARGILLPLFKNIILSFLVAQMNLDLHSRIHMQHRLWHQSVSQQKLALSDKNAALHAAGVLKNLQSRMPYAARDAAEECNVSPFHLC